ncbi:hypothetical protein [Terribacillus saccharophilus]|uniref:hypothetical protein n=1 Tax=Terribacillus saccharophilus TaxID=361277 RepID=UPI003D2AD244
MRKPRKEAVYYPDETAQANAAQAKEVVDKIMKQPVFRNVTLLNGWSSESNKPVKYASLVENTIRFSGAGVPGTRTKGTQLFRLDEGYRPVTNKYLGVDVKGLPKGGIRLNVLGLIGATIGVSEGLTTGRTILLVNTDGWVTLNDELSPSCVLVFDGASIDLT